MDHLVPKNHGDIMSTSARAGSIWAPLRVEIFRALWLAVLASNIGTWMQTVGAQWLLVNQPHASLLVALVQTADMLPDVLLAYVGGVLADLPRLKDIGSQKLYRPEAGSPEAYERLQPVLTRAIDWDLIRNQYDEMVKYEGWARQMRSRSYAVSRGPTCNTPHIGHWRS